MKIMIKKKFFFLILIHLKLKFFYKKIIKIIVDYI